MINERFPNQKSGKSVPLLCNEKASCCGCTACYSICPVKAISMQEDKEGFLYPFIDEEKCIKCGSCLSVCSFKADLNRDINEYQKPLVYGCKLKDEQTRKISSSGGAFTALSDVFLDNGNAIVCSVYNYSTNQQEFRLIETIEERNKARGSKYVQSIPGRIFEDVEEWINRHNEKSVAFFGMGCQAAGFAKFARLKGIRDKVTIVDIICHGSPSPLIWREYVQTIIEGEKELEYLTFKDKRTGWMGPTAYASINGKEVSLKKYVNIFYGCNELRPSCHRCPYASIYRDSDITIGDYWGIDKVNPKFYDPLGVSLLLIHTSNGEMLFDKAKCYMEWMQSNCEDCLQPNLLRPTPHGKNRKSFWDDYYKHGIKYIIRKYGDKPVTVKMKNKIISYLKKIR